MTPASVVRRPSTFSNIFSKTTAPIELKFYIETLTEGGGGAKICSNGLGHTTKMAATPIYGKTPLKHSSVEPEGC